MAVTVLVPYRPDTSGSNFSDLLPADSPVFKVEQRILAEFRVPLLSGTTVVVHQADGLSLLTRADSLLWALATTQDTLQVRHTAKAGHHRGSDPGADRPGGRHRHLPVRCARHRPARRGAARRPVRRPLQEPAGCQRVRHRLRSGAGGPDRLPRLAAAVVRDRQRAGDHGHGRSSPFVRCWRHWSWWASQRWATWCTSRCCPGSPRVLGFTVPGPARARPRRPAAGRRHRLLRVAFLSLPGRATRRTRAERSRSRRSASQRADHRRRWT